LINRYQPWIYNLAFRMVMVREDAEDVTPRPTARRRYRETKVQTGRVCP
jgi:hypothetical protein